MAIQKKEAYYNSTDGKNLIHTLIWFDDDSDPLGIVQLVHGLTDHIGRYDRFARFLANNGFIVCGEDHIGHGKTGVNAGELGNFGAPDTDVRMVDDMHKLHNIMEKRYPGLPYFLIGHSMGTFLSRLYASNFGNELSGLILCGTMYMNSKLSPVRNYLMPIGEIMGAEKYSSTGSDLLGKLTAKFIYKDDDDYAWISVSAQNREESAADPMFNVPITNSSAMMVAKIMLKSCSDECLITIPQDLPIYLISGGKDPIGFFGKGVSDLCDKLEELGIYPEMKLLPGLRHEILNEDDYEPIYNDILSWIYKTLQGDFT